jgi:hypothetical protein
MFTSFTTNSLNTMATRSRIGLELSDGSILSVYHHSDGYPSWLGRILTTHYNTKELVEQLIDGGDMSCCWTDERWCSGERHEYGANYYSYRGEDSPPVLDKNLKSYLKDGEEYAYLYKNGEWICWNRHQFNDKDPEIVKIPEVALAV